ncbi:MAG: hypothetical protein HYX68_08285 [Planctomycetes bacterium]|nr:hypothetical protein [Planctomycetota bacterium]
MIRKASGVCLVLISLFGLAATENSVWAQVDVKEFHKKPILFGRKALTIPPASNEEKRLHIGLYNERLAITEDAYRLFFRGDRHVSRLDCDTVFVPARRLRSSGMEVLDCEAEKINFLAHLLELADRVDFVVAVRVPF